MKQKLKIVITGFDVFGSLSYNPSKIIINFINEFIINKKKENANCESGMNACVDFFINNRICLKNPNKSYSLDTRKEIELHENNLKQIVDNRYLNHNNNNNGINVHMEVKERERESKEKGQSIPLNKLKGCNVEEIKNYLTALACFFNENCFEFVKSEVCSVNKEAVDEMIHNIYKHNKEEKDTEIEDENKKEKSSTNQIIVIHIGVCALANLVTLESTGTNLFIDIPEISLENTNYKDLSLKEHIQTTLNVENIIKQLNEERNCNVQLSHDSGTYFCNYIYYQSLKAACKYSIPVLFIHVRS